MDKFEEITDLLWKLQLGTLHSSFAFRILGKLSLCTFRYHYYSKQTVFYELTELIWEL